MQLNIHNFPSKFPCSISPIFNKTFSLFDEINNFAPYRETLDNPFHFFQDIFIVLTLLHVLGDDFGLEFVLEQGDTFSTALLRDHKLITIYLLEIGILLRVCLLGEIQSHTFQYLTRQRSNILIQLPMKSWNIWQVLAQSRNEAKPLLICYLQRPNKRTSAYKFLWNWRTDNELCCEFPHQCFNLGFYYRVDVRGSSAWRDFLLLQHVHFFEGFEGGWFRGAVHGGMRSIVFAVFPLLVYEILGNC